MDKLLLLAICSHHDRRAVSIHLLLSATQEREPTEPPLGDWPPLTTCAACILSMLCAMDCVNSIEIVSIGCLHFTTLLTGRLSTICSCSRLYGPCCTLYSFTGHWYRLSPRRLRLLIHTS